MTPPARLNDQESPRFYRVDHGENIFDRRVRLHVVARTADEAFTSAAKRLETVNSLPAYVLRCSEWKHSLIVHTTVKDRIFTVIPVQRLRSHPGTGMLNLVSAHVRHIDLEAALGGLSGSSEAGMVRETRSRIIGGLLR